MVTTMKIDIKKIIGDNRKKTLIYILGAVGILILFFASINDDEPQIPETVTQADYDYCKELETRLEEILPTIAGVGNVDVMITAKNYGQLKLAENKNDTNKQTVILNQKGGGEDAKIIEETLPEIQGVIIAADGGKSDRVKKELTEAVTALLGVEAHRIKIFERNISQ